MAFKWVAQNSRRVILYDGVDSFIFFDFDIIETLHFSRKVNRLDLKTRIVPILFLCYCFYSLGDYISSESLLCYHTTAFYMLGCQLIGECCSITLSCRQDGIGTSVSIIRKTKRSKLEKFTRANCLMIFEWYFFAFQYVIPYLSCKAFRIERKNH